MDDFNFYVYAYISKHNLPYYIGKGKNKRAWEKHTNIQKPKDKSKIVILENNLSEIGSLALERRYIRWYGRKDLGTGILENKSDGGSGNAGVIGHGRGGRTWTEEEKKKKRESMLGKNNVCFGRKMSEEQKENLRSFRGEKHHAYGKPGPTLGRKASKETIEKHLNREKDQCSRCGKIATKAMISRWHNYKCTNEPITGNAYGRF